jgi:Trk K+ transport system NAD-binding subunit
MAIIDEMRAKGPFTRIAIGVTVVKDVLVIILFAIVFAIAIALYAGSGFSASFVMVLLTELGLSFLSGYLIYRLMAGIFRLKVRVRMKTILMLVLAYGIYFYSHQVRHWSEELFQLEIYLEPLLMSIIASFLLTNYSRHRIEFETVLQLVLPYVYVAFFTLTGASALLDLLVEVWPVALLLFGIRLLTMMLGSLVGGLAAGDPPKYYRIGWMPYVTQAGVGIGLATVVSAEFPTWGPAFETLIIAVIILNQVIGPPLFKWSIRQVGEDHQRAPVSDFDGERDAVIFGLESKSVALGIQLHNHGWNVRIASRHATPDEILSSEIPIVRTSGIDLAVMQRMEVEKAETVIMMMDDEDNYRLCELAYEHFGTKHLVVRLNERINFPKFHKLGALVVNPATAIVSLLDHFVRSPHATSLLLGLEENQDSVDVEVQNPNLIGMTLRELHLPSDAIVLSVSRGGQLLISHGFTRLRRGDILTLVGSIEALENVRLRFEVNQQDVGRTIRKG